jgi:hypothetical protein
MKKERKAKKTDKKSSKATVVSSNKQHITIRIDNSKKNNKKVSGGGGQRSNVQYIPMGNSNPQVMFLPNNQERDSDIFKILQTLSSSQPVSTPPLPVSTPFSNPISNPAPSTVPISMMPTPISTPIKAPAIPYMPTPQKQDSPLPKAGFAKDATRPTVGDFVPFSPSLVPSNPTYKDDDEVVYDKPPMPKNPLQEALNNSERVKKNKENEKVVDMSVVKKARDANLPKRRRVGKKQMAEALDIFVRNNVPIPYEQGAKERKFEYVDRLNAYLNEHFDEVLDENTKEYNLNLKKPILK